VRWSPRRPPERPEVPATILPELDRRPAWGASQAHGCRADEPPWRRRTTRISVGRDEAADRAHGANMPWFAVSPPPLAASPIR
jgi:hypothetical protein